MRPGARLRSWANRWCSQSTMDRLIDPIIADMQHEHATACGRRRERRFILMKGYLAFWKVMILHVPVGWTSRVLRELAHSKDWAVGRAIGSAAIAMFLLTALLVAPPLQRDVNRWDIQIASLVLLLLPQALPLSLPISLLVGVVYGLRGRKATSTVRRAVLVVGLFASLASFATMRWVMPAANQAWRVAIARQVVVRGMNENSWPSIREQARASRSEGRLDRAGTLFFAYHARWALAGAALAFALFGLGVIALRVGAVTCLGISVAASLVYVSYFFELGSVSSSLFSDERLAVALAWLPNAVMVLTSVIFLSARDESRLAEKA
jgi:lipopolysaccharide export LptBFGC system permease protein LptF